MGLCEPHRLRAVHGLPGGHLLTHDRRDYLLPVLAGYGVGSRKPRLLLLRPRVRRAELWEFLVHAVPAWHDVELLAHGV